MAALAVYHFANRFRGVEAAGVVRGGLSVEQVSDPDASLEDYSGYGIFKIDYTIDGANHTGLIMGRFSTGQQVVVNAPTDGSPFTQLQLADSGVAKTLSWVSMVLGLPLAVIGTWWVTVAIRDRSRRIKAQVRRQYGLPTIAEEARLKAYRRSQSAAPPQPPIAPNDPPVFDNRPHVPDNYFTKPYDI